jgi:F-type H+-transporting ATPase subunit delta
MTQTAKIYGGALYDLAAEESRTEQILEEMTTLAAAFQGEPEFMYLLATPSLSKSERCGILDECFRGKVDGYLLNFLKILCENGTIRQFPGCLQEFKRRYNEENGILEVCAVTAVPMNEALSEKLCARLAAVTGKKIALTRRVDAACLGGVRLEMEGEQMDGTVKGRLAGLSRIISDINV